MHYRKPRVDGNFGDVVAVTDNAANEKKAFEILGWPRLPCNGQNLNLVVKAGLKEVSKVVAKARSIVTMGMLESKQKLLLKEECHGHKLPTDTPTRWNSTFEMLVRVVEQTAAIRAVADDPLCPGGQDLKRKLLTMNEQLLIQSLITILKPFKMATEDFSFETEPSLSRVVPVLMKLQKVLEINEMDDPPAVKRMKQAMQANMEKRQTSEVMQLCRLASLLDPRTKHLKFLTDEEKDGTAKELLKLCLELGKDSNSETVTDETEEAADLPTKFHVKIQALAKKTG